MALHLPAALIKNPPIAELLTPNAEDWLEFEPEPDYYSNDDGTPQVLAEADLKTGKVVEVDPRLAGVETPLILGPDGNVWFGGQNSHGALVLAYVTVRRRVHRFIVTGPSAGEMTGIASGSDGAVWFTWLTHRGTTRLGRMSLDGQTRTFPLARTQEVRSFLPAAGGGFWAAFSRRPTKIDRISTSGQVVRTIDAPLAPATLDAHGALWGFDDQKAQYLDRIENDGQLRRVTGNPPEPNRFAGLEAVVLAADGRLWFTGDSGAATDYPGQDPDIENILGEVEPDLSVQTWPTALSNEDEAPQGNQYVSPPLAAGPDGRLYAIGNVPQANMSWDLLAITLPDQPAMRPASVHLNKVSSRGRTIQVRLSCTGQAGRVCEGTISVQGRARTSVKHAYALTPGLQATRTVTTSSATASDSITVTAVDPLAHSVETRHVRATP